MIKGFCGGFVCLQKAIGLKVKGRRGRKKNAAPGLNGGEWQRCDKGRFLQEGLQIAPSHIYNNISTLRGQNISIAPKFSYSESATEISSLRLSQRAVRPRQPPDRPGEAFGCGLPTSRIETLYVFRQY